MLNAEIATSIPSPLVSVDPTAFRQVMRRFPTGVTLLTVRAGDAIHGMTANSFTSVSLDPVLVLVCIKRNSATHEFVSRAGNFAINILSDAQELVARRFARQVAAPSDPFADLAYHAKATGAPVLDDCIAFLDCRVVAAHDAGDHTIFVGEVLALGFGASREANPLLWLDGTYETLAR